jgi:hypothetical protein
VGKEAAQVNIGRYRSKENEMNTTERSEATRLVEIILSKGYLISVYDGEEYAVRLSDKLTDIMDSLDSTGIDVMYLSKATDAPKPEKAGWVQLVWGNEEDGSEIISDHSANQALNEIMV